MDHNLQDIENYLSVGLAAYLHPRSPGKEAVRFKTFVRGWHKGTHILLETPQGEGKLPMFVEDLPCTVRFLHEGYACGFETRILESGRMGGFGYGRVAWPRQVETVRVRKQTRVPTALSCVVKRSNGVEFGGTIDDISTGGCCIRCETSAPPVDGEIVSLAFTMPDATQVSSVTATVRRARPNGSEYLLGCEFTEEENASSRQDINFYIITSQEQSRGDRGDRHRALIIDDNKTSAGELHALLRDTHWETFVATGIVDAFYRVRALNPFVVFIGCEQANVPAIQMARIIKTTKGLEKTLVLVYGSDSMAVHDEALEAGADGFFSSPAKSAAVRATLARFAPETTPAR
ncbi:MAG: PilZ domain-containing protein [FCB group bacterium]|jgi:c-di-GMP-binding flagellar brake protein YcgR/ActR/RegA family two-component response regulator|nr:PilZ domain-containing protein [FCB group bacterium]